MSETSPPRKRRKRLVLLVAVVLLLAAGALYGVPYVRYELRHESTDDAFVEGTVATMSFQVSGRVKAVHVADNEQVASGTLLAELDPEPFEVRRREARAALASAKAKLAGMEASVALAREVLTADEGAAQAAVAVAEAEVTAARSSVDVAKARLESARIDVKVARAEDEQAGAGAASAQAQADLDSKDLEHARHLFERKTVSRSDLEHAEAAARVSASRLDAARKAATAAAARVEQATTRVAVEEGAVAQAEATVQRAVAGVAQAQAQQQGARSEKRKVEVAEAQRDEQRAEVERAASDLAQAELDLGYARLTAPVAGRVTRKSLSIGEWVQPGQSVLALVPAEVWVIANYKETQIGDIQPGQTVTIRIDAFPDHVFHGRVDSIQAGTGSRFSLLPPENATGNYVKVVQRVPVKILFDPLPDPERYPLSPGMSAVPSVCVADE